MLADGSVTGYTSCALDSGQIFKLDPESWNFVNNGTAVDICYKVEPIKGIPPFPTDFCFSDLGVALPITGLPMKVNFPGSDETTVIRVRINQ